MLYLKQSFLIVIKFIVNKNSCHTNNFIFYFNVSHSIYIIYNLKKIKNLINKLDLFSLLRCTEFSNSIWKSKSRIKYFFYISRKTKKFLLKDINWYHINSRLLVDKKIRLDLRGEPQRNNLFLFYSFDA